MKKIFPLFIFATLFFPFLCFSYQIENIPVEPQGDFILAPGKIELWLNPGEKVTKEIVVTNRLGKKMKFAVEIEDFVGSFELEKPIILLGHEKGPYSLKDYIKPEIKEFTLEHGQRITIPIEIAIPENAEPGGKYGAVIVSTVPEIAKEKEKEKVETGVVVVARLANLFFVRVKGEVKEEGMLKEFNIAKKLYFDQNPEFKFKLIFENKGNVHLAPYGIIEFFNFWGKKIS
ncbi:hypothetical protein H5T58_03700, partial [Candidatus Parcubacteria bacterium]|nr:hypothetical protein [Candidatus Parcubacteria bacterium]